MSFTRLSKTRLLTYGLWLLVILLLWWVGRGLDLAALAETLSRLTVQHVVLLLGLNAGLFFLFTVRWWWILRSLGYRRSIFRLVKYRLTAFGITYFTPGPQFGGEPFQVYALHKREAVPLSTSVSAVTLDKLAELIANFSFLLVGVLIILRYGFFPILDSIPILPMGLVLVAIPIFYLILLWSGRLPLAASSRFLIRKSGRSERVQKALRAAETAEIDLANTCREQPRLLFTILLLSVGLVGRPGLRIPSCVTISWAVLAMARNHRCAHWCADRVSLPAPWWAGSS